MSYLTTHIKAFRFPDGKLDVILYGKTPSNDPIQTTLGYNIRGACRSPLRQGDVQGVDHAVSTALIEMYTNHTGSFDSGIPYDRHEALPPDVPPAWAVTVCYEKGHPPGTKAWSVFRGDGMGTRFEGGGRVHPGLPTTLSQDMECLVWVMLGGLYPWDVPRVRRDETTGLLVFDPEGEPDPASLPNPPLESPHE